MKLERALAASPSTGRMEEPMMVDQVDEAGSKGRPGQCVLQTKTNPIIEDYSISSTVLGLGINGKVVECFSKKDNAKYALKVML